MDFSTYLRLSRKQLELTQEEFVEKLYLFNDTVFSGINPATLSRWEREISIPSLTRISSIIAYFQEEAKQPLPYVELLHTENMEQLLCEPILSQLFKPKSMVGKLELKTDSYDAFELQSLRHHPNAKELTELITMLHKGVNTPFTQVKESQFNYWMDNPSNLFTTLVYKSILLGLFFVLRLKPESFQKIITFKMRKDELSDIDFAPIGEEASLYILSFYSLTQPVATSLFHRFYAHLITYQSHIKEVGFISSFQEANNLAEKMELQKCGAYFDNNTEIIAYKNDLFSFFKALFTLKVIFPKHSCLD
jgi:transcriptional regulator with XRE-family HTH domain